MFAVYMGDSNNFEIELYVLQIERKSLFQN